MAARPRSRARVKARSRVRATAMPMARVRNRDTVTCSALFRCLLSSPRCPVLHEPLPLCEASNLTSSPGLPVIRSAFHFVSFFWRKFVMQHGGFG